MHRFMEFPGQYVMFGVVFGVMFGVMFGYIVLCSCSCSVCSVLCSIAQNPERVFGVRLTLLGAIPEK